MAWIYSDHETFVNEVNKADKDASANAAAIGSLADLDTETKTSIVAAINELVARIEALEPETDGGSEVLNENE